MSSSPTESRKIEVECPDTNSGQKFYTPKPKQMRVIAQHLMGESNRQIAREEKLDRATVAKILTQPEAVAMRARQKSYAERLGYKALVVIDETLDSDFPQLAFAAAVKHLEGIGVYDKRGLQGTIDDEKAKQFKTPDDILDSIGLDEFPWPPPEPASQPEPKKRARRKPPKVAISK